MIPPLRLPLRLFLVFTLFAATEAIAQSTPIELGTLDGTFSFPRAVNDIGQVVGDSTIGPGTARHAFLWTAIGGLVDLGTLGGANSVAIDVNANGQIAGVSETTTGAAHGFLWTPTGGMVDLGTLGGGSSEAVGVNDHGQVVGSSDTTAGTHAFLWTATGGMVDLGTLGGSGSKAVALNDHGQVVGSSDTSAAAIHAFAWTPRDGMVDLGTLGGTTSYADALNNRGDVVGRAETVDGGVYHAFVWSPVDGMVDLGTLGGTNSAAFAVNDGGRVVGWSQTAGNTATHAFVWTATEGMVDLGTLGGTNSWASAVNSSGQVVGASVTAGNTALHAFGWTASDGMVELAPLDGGFSEALFINNLGQAVGTSYDPFGNPDNTRATIWQLPVDADDWTFCASEGGVCAFTGTAEVRYGANGSFVYQTLTDGTGCTNDVFGDPIYGTLKECAIKTTPPTTDWTLCAPEGSVCAFTGTTEVRYGANGSFVYKTLTDGTACTNDVFGDPIYGTVKQCAIKTPPPTEWTFCASEGGGCAFTGTAEVRYGANGSYFFKTLTDGSACTNEVFGDPVYGVVKACDWRTGSGSSPLP